MTLDVPTVDGAREPALTGVTPGPRVREAGRWEHAVMRPGLDLAGLDGLVRAAALAAGAPLATLATMGDRQVLASVQYVADYPVRLERGRVAALEDTVCLLPVRAGATVTITDATRDSRVSSLPITVVGGFRAYLGTPLRARSGDVVAVLCVYDDHVRDWTDEQRHALERTAARAEGVLQRLVDGDLGAAGACPDEPRRCDR